MQLVVRFAANCCESSYQRGILVSLARQVEPVYATKSMKMQSRYVGDGDTRRQTRVAVEEGSF